MVSIFTSAYVFYWSQYFLSKPLKYPPSFDSRVVLYPSAKEVRDYFSWRQADSGYIQLTTNLRPDGLPVLAHINNLQNTCFWSLVKSGMSTTEANKALRVRPVRETETRSDSFQGTESKDKNELLFSRFGINYNTINPMFRKGSILLRVPPATRDVDRTAGTADLLMTEDDEAGSESSSLPADDLRLLERKGKRPKPYEGLTGVVSVLHEDIIRDGFWEVHPWLLA